MKKFKLLFIISIGICAILFIGPASISQAYTWQTYNGHEYALTNDAESWVDAESEAVFAGGYLVTINDAAENAWLTATFTGITPAGLDIGYHFDSTNGWIWASGEAVTYTNLWSDWNNYTGNYAYMHTNNNTNAPGGTWNHAYWHTDPPGDNGYLQGIIERPATSVPEPATMLLLGLGLVGLAGVRRKFQK